MNKKILADLKILCVDDSEDALHLITAVLQHNGAVVTSCHSAADAMTEIKASKFDVIVSDISMPSMDGYDLAHALRADEKSSGHQTTPTIAVSGDANTPSNKRRFADFQVYMMKPFCQKNLVNIIGRLAEADGDAVEAGSLFHWDKKQDLKSPLYDASLSG